MSDHTEDLVTFILDFMQEAGDDEGAIRDMLRRQLRAYGNERATAERERCVNAVADVAVTWPPHSAEFNALLDAAAAIRALDT